jgi:hypothetical protein
MKRCACLLRVREKKNIVYLVYISRVWRIACLRICISVRITSCTKEWIKLIVLYIDDHCSTCAQDGVMTYDKYDKTDLPSVVRRNEMHYFVQLDGLDD